MYISQIKCVRKYVHHWCVTYYCLKGDFTLIILILIYINDYLIILSKLSLNNIQKVLSIARCLLKSKCKFNGFAWIFNFPSKIYSTPFGFGTFSNLLNFLFFCYFLSYCSFLIVVQWLISNKNI